MKAYGTQAKIPADKQHFHTLKHSIATHLVSKLRNDKAREVFLKLPKY